VGFAENALLEPKWKDFCVSCSKSSLLYGRRMGIFSFCFFFL